MAITLGREQERRALASIRQYFAEVLEQEIGDLKASMALDFFLREIGPCVYNHAIADAQAILQERVAELDAVRYEPEFGYWERSEGPGVRPGSGGRDGTPGS